MLWILGHELGHIKSGHVLYRSIAKQFNTYFKKLGSLTLGLTNLATLPAEASAGKVAKLVRPRVKEPNFLK